MPQNKYYQAIGMKEAKKLLENHFILKPNTEQIAILKADDRILAEDIYSTINVPHFNRAMRDGFAVRAEDTFIAEEEAPVRLKVVDNVFAGDVPNKNVKAGECIQIATGAPIPSGADAVVMVEYSNFVNENEVEIFTSVVPGQYIIKIGNDIKKGTTLLKKNTRLNPRAIGALAAIGKQKVSVFSLPKITLFSTGNEVTPLNEELELGKIYDINSYTLQASIQRTGANVVFKGILPDELRQAKHSILKSLTASDLIILSGGTSKGLGDIFPSIIQDLGDIDLFIHGIRIKPGKPTAFTSLKIKNNCKFITMLPGYPTSAVMIFNIFLKDIIEKWSQTTTSYPKFITASLSERVYSELGRHEFKTVKLKQGINEIMAIPTKTGSDAIKTLLGMDGYFEIPEQVQFVEESEEIKVKLFDN